jgi:hypothetical protein
MREIEFLPDWYPRVRRQRAWFRVQAWATVVLLVGVTLYVAVQRRSLFIAESTQRSAAAEVADTRSKVRELDEQVRLQRELLGKQTLVAQLGLPVELTRIIAEVGDCMPSEMSLEEIDINTSETERSVADQQRGRGTTGPREATKSRKLRVTVTGVAPTDSQVYSFFGRLADRRFLDNVRLERTGERRTREHVMRDFVVSFEVSLDYAATTPSVATVNP